MKVIYIADDGKEFDNAWDCEDYEWQLNHKHLNDVHCYDKDGNELKDIFSEDTYCKVMTIIVPTYEAAKDMQDLARYTCYCFYDHITESGVWVFDEDKDRFVKEREI